jgi:hypothetical protein
MYRSRGSAEERRQLAEITRSAGGGQASQAARQAEVTRLVEAGFSRDIAELAMTPVISRSADPYTLPAGQCSYIHDPGRRDGSPHDGPCVPRQEW